jgi:hypothetical protein
MKRFRRILVWGGTALALLYLVGLVYATATGRVAWFRSVRRVVITEDGKAVPGRLHRCLDERDRVLILTRRLPHGWESYWIDLPGIRPDRPGYASSCAGWSAPALPLFYISHLDEPCILFVEKGPNGRPYIGKGANARPAIEPADRRFVMGPSSLAFITDDGKRIQVSWR